MDPTYKAAAQLSGNLLSFAGKAATEVLDAAAASANIPKVGPPTVIVVSTDGSYGPTLQLILKELTKMSAEVQALKAQIDSTLQAIQDAVDEINAEVSQLASNVGDAQIVTDSTSRLKTLTDTLTQTVAAAKNNPAPTPPAPTPEPNPTPTPEPPPAPTPDPTPVPEPTPVDPNAPTT